MNDERYPYDEWVNQALQGVLRRALTTLSTMGFSRDHHLFISFDTNYPGARLPGFLRAQYPDEITIVLQHQFEDLMVAEDLFQVSLSFNGQKHQLVVPFAAVRSFADPSVNFGLQINQSGAPAKPSADAPRPRGSVPDSHRRTQLSELSTQPEEAEEMPAVKTAGSGNRDHAGAAAPAGAEVITLDAFRKK